ncbi:MAG: hypothetical protein AB1757_28265 [Acidobacteriota bacterium]
MLIPKLTFADNRDEENLIRLYAIATVAPIGVVKGEIIRHSSLTINGRQVWGERAIWNGDLLHGQGRTLVEMDTIGQVKLARGTLVRLATNHQSPSEQKGGVLIASLMSGEISVALNKNATGFIQAGGLVFTSTPGARFHIDIKEGRASYELTEGNLTVEAGYRQKKYTIQAVGRGDTYKVPYGQLSNIRVQIRDENNKPLAEVPVMFSLAPSTVKGLGTLGLGTMASTTFSTLTNNEGIATVPFNAGRTKGTTSVTAVIEATGDTWTGQIEVDSYSNKSRNGWIVVGVAAAIGGGVAAYNLTRENDSIKVSPPTTK